MLRDAMKNDMRKAVASAFAAIAVVLCGVCVPCFGFGSNSESEFASVSEAAVLAKDVFDFSLQLNAAQVFDNGCPMGRRVRRVADGGVGPELCGTSDAVEDTVATYGEWSAKWLRRGVTE